MPGPRRSLHLGSNLTVKRASTETQRVALRSVCSKEPGTFEAQSFEPLMEIRSVECGFTVSPCHHPMLGRVDRTKGRSSMLGTGFQFWSRLCSAGGAFLMDF